MKLEEIARFTVNVDAAVAFYRKLLGQEPASWRPGETATFMLGGVKFFLHTRSERKPDWPSTEDHVSFAVDDVDATCEALRRSGVVFELPPRDYYWGRSAYLRDTEGRLLEIHKA